MHQTQWSPERPLPRPASLTFQSHHEKPPEVTCTSRGTPGFLPQPEKDQVRVCWVNVCIPQSPAQQKMGSDESLLWRPHGLWVHTTMCLTGFICCHLVFQEVLWTASKGLGFLFTDLEWFQAVIMVFVFLGLRCSIFRKVIF